MDFFNHTIVLFGIFMIIDTDQQNFSGIILQAICILLIF